MILGVGLEQKTFTETDDRTATAETGLAASKHETNLTESIRFGIFCLFGAFDCVVALAITVLVQSQMCAHREFSESAAKAIVEFAICCTSRV